ncbi:MAG: plastocyanin/azurin family copper-binding protein [Dehalococcoidia bacterium]|nr:plastocyanin/azurin family copper-binding protein [Dehalococcoidia bacterium]
MPSYPMQATVQLQALHFVPSAVDIAAGGTVVFSWVTGMHNVLSTGTPGFEGEPDLKSNGSHSATFGAPGSYAFTCQVHSSTMNGVVRVH